MASTFRSDVLSREEKAMGSITFPRFLACTMISGAAYFLCSKFLSAVSLCIAPFLFAFVLYWSSSKYGIMRFMWFFYDTKARFVMFLSDYPSSPIAQFMGSLQLDTGTIFLDADDLFVPEKQVEAASFAGIEFLDDDQSDVGGVEFLDGNFEFEVRGDNDGA